MSCGGAGRLGSGVSEEWRERGENVQGARGGNVFVELNDGRVSHDVFGPEVFDRHSCESVTARKSDVSSARERSARGVSQDGEASALSTFERPLELDADGIE